MCIDELPLQRYSLHTTGIGQLIDVAIFALPKIRLVCATAQQTS
jgi:hypothetical protein